MKVVAIIPARLKSERFPNKLLYKLNGKRIIDHVIENTKKFDFVDDIIIASDDIEFVKSLYDKYEFIKDYHVTTSVTCGSHRAYKFYLTEPDYDFYISIPADEPSINPIEINKVLKTAQLNNDEITTLYTKFYCEDDLISPLSCKIVTCNKHYMIYNSRAVVPINKDGRYLNLEQYKKHVGVFIFPKQVFDKYGDLWSDTHDIESLEQNRFLQHNNIKIKMIEVKHIGFGIDVPEQIEKLEMRINETFSRE
ncbi:MAG: hypothetical protein K9L62_10460 [Vallitaleaceae bacterium]|nr:hypothetical protein [Vallitaleaceae bacterium]